MDARNRRMWVLPTPKGNIDKRDRYMIGIFHSFIEIIQIIAKPLHTIFTVCAEPVIFMSKRAANVFTSLRKRGQTT